MTDTVRSQLLRIHPGTCLCPHRMAHSEVLEASLEHGTLCQPQSVLLWSLQFSCVPDDELLSGYAGITDFHGCYLSMATGLVAQV